jgi:hypothetical protein
MAMGDVLAEKVKVILAEANIEVDVVIPVRTFLFSPRSLMKRFGLGS